MKFEFCFECQKEATGSSRVVTWRDAWLPCGYLTPNIEQETKSNQTGASVIVGTTLNFWSFFFCFPSLLFSFSFLFPYSSLSLCFQFMFYLFKKKGAGCCGLSRTAHKFSQKYCLPKVSVNLHWPQKD